ncbi:unnamed protein product [Victoria cruziana]
MGEAEISATVLDSVIAADILRVLAIDHGHGGFSAAEQVIINDERGNHLSREN